MKSLEQTKVWCYVTFCSHHPVKEFVCDNFGIEIVNSSSLEMKLHLTSISFHIGPFVSKHSCLLLGWTFELLDYRCRLSEICSSSFLQNITKVWLKSLWKRTYDNNQICISKEVLPLTKPWNWLQFQEARVESRFL